MCIRDRPDVPQLPGLLSWDQFLQALFPQRLEHLGPCRFTDAGAVVQGQRNSGGGNPKLSGKIFQFEGDKNHSFLRGDELKNLVLL